MDRNAKSVVVAILGACAGVLFSATFISPPLTTVWAVVILVGLVVAIGIVVFS